MQKSIFLFFTIINVCISQAVLSQAYLPSQIDSIVNKAMEANPSAGIAIAVVKDNKVVHLKGYGVTSVNTKEKVNENTLFAIASNTKAFTSAALAMLVDEGKISWTDKVVKYLPEFKMYDPYITENFNIQDLLTHRSGLGLGAGDLMFFPDGSDFTVDDVLKSFQYQKPVSAFRTKYDYDNLLYIVAGEVVARVSGMSWSEYIDTKIMKPLGMNRSASLYHNIKDKTNMAFPHAIENSKLKQFEPYAKEDNKFGAAGGIYASVNDLTKWLFMHLNHGKYSKESSMRLISDKNHDELWKAHTNISFSAMPRGPYKSHFKAYGLGWSLSDMKGYVVAEHGGYVPGMLSRTVMIPELDLGIIVLTNTDPGGYSYHAVSQMILDAYIGAEKKDWIASATQRLKASGTESDSVSTAVWATVAKANQKSISHTDYVGIYQDDWFGKIEIWSENNKLWFKSLRSPKLTGEMSYYQANTFAIKWNYTDMPCDALTMFGLDENGKAISIKMKGISPNIDFSFDFQDLDLKRIE